MNPVFHKDLKALIRLGRIAVMQMLCVLTLGAVVLATWPQQGFVSLSTQSRDDLALWLMVAQLALVIIFVPGVAALSISSEIEANSLEMLYTSRLTALQIILGKLFSALAWPAILLISALPFMAMAYHRGGIDLSQLTNAYAILVLSAIVLAVLALTASAWCSQSSTALVIAYVVTLVICGLVLVPAALMLDAMEGELASLLHRLRSISPIAAILSVLRPALSDFGGTSREFLPAWKIFLPFAGATTLLCGALLTYRLSKPPVQPARTSKPVEGKRSLFRRLMFLLDHSKQRKPLGRFNPFIGKERRDSQMRSGSWLLRVFYGTLLLSLGLAAMSLYGGAEHSDLLRYIASVLVLLQFAVIGVVTPSLSSSLISSEIAYGTFELIRLTPLRPGEIFWGKLVSAILPAMLPVVALLPAYIAICFINRAYVAGLFPMFIIVGVAVAFCCSVGLACSAFFESTARATIVSYVIIVSIFALPLFAWLAGGNAMSYMMARACGFPSPLVVALNLLPSGDSSINAMWPAHCAMMIALCLVILITARMRLARLLQNG